MIYIILKLLLLSTITGFIAGLIPATIVFITIFIIYFLVLIVKLILEMELKFIIILLSLLITLFVAIFYAYIFLHLLDNFSFNILIFIFIFFVILNISLTNYLIPLSENDLAVIKNNADLNPAYLTDESIQLYSLSLIVVIYLRFFKYALMPLTVFFIVFPKTLEMLPSFPEFLAYHLVTFLVKFYGYLL